MTSRRFTVDEYDRMAAVGILGPEDRVELIEGVIVRMEPIGSRHAGCVLRLNRLFSTAPGGRALVAVQSPVRLSEASEPEPDLALLRVRADDYTTGHPRPADILLLIEVADSTLEKDREIKGPLYAAAGIREYWLVDLEGDAIEVYRSPTGGKFGEFRRHRRGEVLRAGAFPDLDVLVEAILP